MDALFFLLNCFISFLELDLFESHCESHCRWNCLAPWLQGAVVRGTCFLLPVRRLYIILWVLDINRFSIILFACDHRFFSNYIDLYQLYLYWGALLLGFFLHIWKKKPTSDSNVLLKCHITSTILSLNKQTNKKLKLPAVGRIKYSLGMQCLIPWDVSMSLFLTTSIISIIFL